MGRPLKVGLLLPDVEGMYRLQLWLDPANPAAVEAFAPVLEDLDRG